VANQNNPSGNAKTIEIPNTEMAKPARISTQDKWIGRIIATREAGETEKIDRVIVSSGPHKSKMTRLITLRIRDESKVDEMIADIDSAIRTSGHKHAKVEALRPGERVPEFTRSWEIPIEIEGEEIEEESPDLRGENVNSAAAGLLRQAYHHNDVFLATMKGMVGETMQHYRETSLFLREENAALRKENTDLAQKLSTREDERLERDKSLEREKAVVNGFQNIVSALSVRLSGSGETIPKHLSDLLNGLSGEQQDQLLTILTPEQKTLLAAIFQTVSEKAKP